MSEMTPICAGIEYMELTDKQIERCYDTYYFEEDELITSAYINKGQLHIIIKNTMTEDETDYEPAMYDNEDYLKVDYILYGGEEYV